VNQARFQKQQREKARREKAAAKYARKEQRREERDEASPAAPVDSSAILAELAAIHERFDAGELELDDFLAARDELTRQLTDD
jgi:hypothetical protein